MNNTKLIKDYFKGKTIFITGGTGFVGKALIEKLLRSCPELKRIYVLIRPRKGKALYERVDDITSNPIFSSLKRKFPENIKKIHAILGDIKEIRLGISEEDRQLLIDEVHIFFHAAASVRLEGFLEHSIFANVRSAREAALLALEMNQLEVFLHVSTTYCSIENRKVVEEILYPPQGDWKDTITVAEKCNPVILNALSRKYIGDFMNTYTYTKRMAEHCVNDLLVGKIPTIIFRPSVVIGTVTDPYMGWTDGSTILDAIMVGIQTGLVRTSYGNPKVHIDFVPVDDVVKAMIIAVWHKANFGPKNELNVYHGSMRKSFYFTQEHVEKYYRRAAWDVPTDIKIWFSGFAVTNCWYNYYINVILFQVIPALFLDMILKLIGYSPLLLRTQVKIFVTTNLLQLIMSNEYKFINMNTMRLKEYISKEEMHEFNFAYVPKSEEITYRLYMYQLDHLKKYLLHERKLDSHQTYIKTFRMYYLDRVCHWLFYTLAIWFIFFKMNILADIWELLSNYLNNKQGKCSCFTF